MANTKAGESAFIVTNGSGSGSNRAENARDIESVIPMISDEDLGKSDVAIIVTSLSGGSGSVISGLLAREYVRRGSRVIMVSIADTSYSVGAKNTLNTLKTFAAIAKNNDIYLPMIMLSNDNANTRTEVDESVRHAIADLINVLTRPVYEVDKNDRLNWIDPSKVVQTSPGLKLMTFYSEGSKIDPKLTLGMGSKEMVDSLMILQGSADEISNDTLPPARLKKTGFYVSSDNKRIVAKVSSDISDIEAIIDNVERQQNLEKAQKHSSIDRLSTNGSEDLYL